MNVPLKASKERLAIAINIRNRRIFRNYSQDYLAFKLNISQNAYSKIELGITRVSLERLFIISEILEANIIDMLILHECSVVEFNFGNILQKNSAI